MAPVLNVLTREDPTKQPKECEEMDEQDDEEQVHQE